MSTPSPGLSRGGVTTAVAGLGALFLVMLIWLPFGTSMLGLIEEWQFPPIFAKSGIQFLTTADSARPQFALRPLNLFAFGLAYLIDPNSFLASHALQMAAFVAKAMAGAYIAWWLTRRPLWAIAAGLLFMVLPADTMQVSLRSLHINWAVALNISAIALLLAATEGRRRLLGAVLAVAAAAVFLLSSLMYEAALFMAPAPLALWWARYGLRNGLALLREHVVPLVAWTVAVAVAAGYLVVVSQSPDLYQKPVSGNLTQTLLDTIGRLPILADTALFRLFVHGWLDAALMLMRESDVWIYLLGVVGLVAAGLVMRMEPAAPGPAPGFLPRLVVVSVVVGALGYLPYLSAPSHIAISQRTFSFASFGGALGAAALIYLLAAWNKALGTLAATCLLCLGMAQQWFQMQHYVDLSNKQRMLLAGTVNALAGVPPDSNILILDRSGYLEKTWSLRGEILGHALTYLRQVETRPLTCSPSGKWESLRLSEYGAPGTCDETADAWIIGGRTTELHTISKLGLIRLDVDPDGVVTRLDGPKGTLTEGEVSRYAYLLRCWPIQACTYAPRAAVRFHQDFGTWWSLDEAWWGSGWDGPVWVPPGWLHPAVSSSWTNAPVANLLFRLSPVEVSYTLRLRIVNQVSHEARASLTATLNGTLLHLVDTGEPIVTAYIPPGTLVQGRNELVLGAPIEMPWGVGINFDWIDIAPNGGP